MILDLYKKIPVKRSKFGPIHLTIIKSLFSEIECKVLDLTNEKSKFRLFKTKRSKFGIVVCITLDLSENMCKRGPNLDLSK